MTGNIRGQLEKARLELLDLSSRNRLVHTPLEASKAARAIRVRDEVAAEVYRLFVTEGKTLTFAAGIERAEPQEGSAAAEQEADLPQPDENEATDERGVKSRHRDTKLQTALTSKNLQKRLLKMYYDARTFSEEQGVNILYLALGFLQWVDESDARKTVRYAPLVLIPATLERQSASEKFRLRWTEEDADANLTLAAKLETEFKIRLPQFPDVNADDFSLPAYYDAVAEVVRSQPGWEVKRDEILLGFFSFAKFLMYRDLDPANWPEGSGLDRHPLVSGLLGPGMGEQRLAIPGGDDEYLDQHLRVEDLAHVVDADSSQTLAIHEARRGANLVIQGPPGTGKSQTIANLIATAVLDGRKVLFLAEKMAALEVVKRRLDAIGLGPMCLEMHSNKVQKRAVLDELGRTLALGKPTEAADTGLYQSLTGTRDTLNRHCERMHRKLMPGEVSAYESMGVLTRLRNRGLAPLDVALESPESWTPEERIRRKNLVGQIAAWIEGNGLPSKHAWRGCAASQGLRADTDLLLSRLQPALSLIEAAAPADFAGYGSVEPAWRLVSFLKGNPGLPKDGSVSASAWKSRTADIADLVRRGAEWTSLQRELNAVVVPAAYEQDLRTTRHNLAVHGDGMFKIVFGAYRAAQNHLSSLLQNPASGMPAKAADKIALADRIMSAQAARQRFRESENLGREAFGSLWRGEVSDWALLQNICAWMTFPDAIPYLHVDVEAAFKPLDRCRQALVWIGSHLGLPAEELCSTSFAALSARVRGWLADPEGLSRWTSFYALASEAGRLGLMRLVQAMSDGTVPAPQALDRFAFTYHNAMLRSMVSREPELARFEGDTHTRLVDHFATLDARLLERNRSIVATKHYAGIPRVIGPVGALGVVTSEIAKKRRHLPLRQLVRQAGPALQALKPVFLMSPLSVAQFLEPGAVAFDLLVVDEASQIEPVDALGAISRCRQAVVVGDDKQLPPTRFFSRMMGAEEISSEDGEDEAAAAGDLESILGLCRAKGFPERMLRWHYRSRHESLIAVSNHEFYESRLFIVPSPFLTEGGLRFHYAPDSLYEPGVGVNRAEAKKVAEAVMQHAASCPQLSLGVGAFSVRQRDAILEELERLRRAQPDSEAFFGSGLHAAEPFFVKNLENVQGDERDVIFISVGYGRDASGTFAMRFGPLNMPGGERRLNVLISRAKLRCEVFSPILADDIDPARAKGRGVTALRTFLKFAESGRLPVLAADAATVAGGTSSKMLDEIAAVVEKAGYEVRRRFGLAGLFVELAVMDPEDKPASKVLLGIEVDGEEYRRARSARDRDRLRAGVLRRQGWNLYRTWSADWYQRPEEQAKKLLAAVEEAKRERSAAKTVLQPAAPVVVAREEAAVDEAVATLGVPYVEATLRLPANREFHDVTIYTMVQLVREVVTVEGPVHEEEIIVRIRQAWGLARAGSRVQQTLRAAISQCDGIVPCGEGFYQVPGKAVEARNRTAVESPGLRKPEMIAPSEWEAAVTTVLRSNLNAGRGEIPLQVARMLGFKLVSGGLRAAVEERVASLLASGVITDRNGMLSLT